MMIETHPTKQISENPIAFEAERMAAPPHDPDFGDLVASKQFMNERLGKFVISHLITVNTYWNPDGYTAIVDPFDMVFGYGETADDAINDARLHLENVRTLYDTIDLKNATEGAVELRGKLSKYLPVAIK